MFQMDIDQNDLLTKVDKTIQQPHQVSSPHLWYTFLYFQTTKLAETSLSQIDIPLEVLLFLS